jgi:hypothetical protein
MQTLFIKEKENDSNTCACTDVSSTVNLKTNRLTKCTEFSYLRVFHASTICAPMCREHQV